MARTLLLVLVAVLTILGVADSWYLFQSAITHTDLVCNIGAGLDGCNIVAQSPYSKLFGLPLALYGIGFFGSMLATAIGLFSFRSRLLYGILFALASMGALASVAFMYIQIALIKAFCIYCIISAAIAFIVFGLALTLWVRYGSQKRVI